MNKPYIICHMVASINGKILTENWEHPQKVKQYSALYNKIHEDYHTQGWILGRVSLEKDFYEGAKAELIQPTNTMSRAPFIGDKTAKSFAVTVDTKGKLAWDTNEIGGDHIIAVLTEDVSDDYLYYLQRKKISYVFAGKKEVDIKKALHHLTTLFPIKQLMLEGGSILNGTFLNEGLIDEFSVLIVPIADGTPNTPTVFEITSQAGKGKAALLKLAGVEKLAGDVVWLRYVSK